MPPKQEISPLVLMEEVGIKPGSARLAGKIQGRIGGFFRESRNQINMLSPLGRFTFYSGLSILFSVSVILIGFVLLATRLRPFHLPYMLIGGTLAVVTLVVLASLAHKAHRRRTCEEFGAQVDKWLKT